jgi:ComEC/Rec2-related protein
LEPIAAPNESMPRTYAPKNAVPTKSSFQNLTAKLKFSAALASETIANDIKEEQARGTGFLFVPVWLGFGSIVYFTAGFEPSGWALLAVVFVLFFVRYAVQRSSGLHLVASILLLIALGAGLAKMQSLRNTTPMLAGEIATQITARVISMNPTAKSHRAVLEILQTAKPQLKHVPRRVRVTLRQVTGQLNAGDVITVRVRLIPPSGPVRPTSYDFAFQSYFDGVGASGFSIGPIIRENLEAQTLSGRIHAILEHLRQTIAARIRAVIKGSEGEVAVALIAGVQTGIDEATMEPLRITGLAHVLSISGLHMALVAGLFMVTMRGGFALFPSLAARLAVKKYAAALALVASFFYLLLSGADVAATRSFLMLAVFLLAIFFDQQALTMRNLSVAAIAILVVTPHEIMGPSFQMSFAATAALISAYAFWTNIKSAQSAPIYAGLTGDIWAKTWRFVGALAMTSIIAGTATSLFSAWHFHRLAPMGLPANLAAMPPVSLIVMPSAVVSALAMPFGLEEWPLKAMGAGISLMLSVANIFAKLSSAGLSGALNTVPFFIATAALALVCLLQTRLKWVALVPVPFLIFAFWTPILPNILVSEDAKLVAVRQPDNVLAVNQGRPNAFTIQAWQKALLATAIQVPNQSTAFSCEDTKCSINLINGKRLTWLSYPKYQRARLEIASGNQTAMPKKQTELLQDRAAIEAILAAKFNAAILDTCGKTDLLILAGPSSFEACKGTNTRVISAKDLALNGAAEIYLINKISRIYQYSDSVYDPENPAIPSNNQGISSNNWFTIKYAIGPPNRPWNYERKFSRAARNLPPFQPIPNTKPNQ